MNNSKGFTIIELVIVIVIVGVLSAFAIPKYLEIRSDARMASIQTAFGAVKAASAMVHALYLAQGGTPTTVTMDNTQIAIGSGTQYANFADTGAPPFGIAYAAGITPGTSAGSYSVSTAGTTVTISIVGATTTATCYVTYKNGSPPTIASDKAGC